MKTRNFYNEWEANKAVYEIYNLNEGMQVAYHKSQGDVILINLIERYAWRILDSERTFVEWTRSDIDYEKVNRLPDNHHARNLRAPYDFRIGHYDGGLAKVTWTLYPAGQYYTSDGGYDIEDNQEIKVHALIDSWARVLVPFTPMTNDEEMCFRKYFGQLVKELMKKEIHFCY